VLAWRHMATAPSPSFAPDQRPASVPIWRERLAGFDWLALRTSAVFYGCGVPRGDGAGVVLVPGFLGTDWYLLELHGWLARIGYRPYLSRIGRNAECLDLLSDRLLETVETAKLAGPTLDDALKQELRWLIRRQNSGSSSLGDRRQGNA